MSARIKELGPEPTPADLTAIPELTDEELADARRVVPKKRPITVRLDDDVLEWLKAGDGPYQTRLNAILRAVMNKSGAA